MKRYEAHMIAEELAKLLPRDYSNDSILTAEQLAEKLGVSASWIYHKAESLHESRWDARTDSPSTSNRSTQMKILIIALGIIGTLLALFGLYCLISFLRYAYNLGEEERKKIVTNSKNKKED